MIEENGATFAMQVDNFIAASGLKAVLVFRDILLEVSSRTILKTPVGNPVNWKSNEGLDKIHTGKGYVGGMLRGNWQIGAGAAPTETLTTPDPSGTATIGAIRARVVRNNVFFAGTNAYLVNNLPYALPIEYGAGPNPYAPNPNWHGSLQAPSGMLRTSVMEYEAEFEARVAPIAAGATTPPVEMGGTA